MKTVISASRRTDIPTFYYDWFQEILKDETVTINNVVYPEKTHTIDLNPENIHSIVLWSKNFNNVLHNPGYLEKYNLYFQYTITGYSKLLEPNVPTYEESLKTLESLLKTYSPKQFNIRFDPIIISTTGENEPDFEKPGSARLKMFDRLCKDLYTLGMEDCRLTTSFIALYPKVIKRLGESGINCINLNNKQQIEFMKRMVEISSKYSRDIYTCANDLFVEAGLEHVKKGHCIDGDILEELFGKCTKAKDSGQREQCGCIKSKDIGSYKHCFHDCLYCYAN